MINIFVKSDKIIPVNFLGQKAIRPEILDGTCFAFGLEKPDFMDIDTFIKSVAHMLPGDEGITFIMPENDDGSVMAYTANRR